MYINQDIADLGNLDENTPIQEFASSSYKILSESSLIPKDGIYLGLDISELSSGICIYNKGKKIGANITLITSEKEEFREVKLRRELKSNLLQLIENWTFDIIFIEDAFQGVNPSTTRALYALNTAIDELILDGLVHCKRFIRVSNQTWKSWLYTIDSEGLYKGITDKLRIEKCLGMLGVHEEGEGFQDRLDSSGMILGYFLCKNKADTSMERKAKKKVAFQDICFDYQESEELALEKAGYGIKSIAKQYVHEQRWGKEKITNYLTDNPNLICITDSMIRLGNLGVKLELPYLEEGGFFSFWINPKKLNKYVEEDKRDEYFE